MILSWINARFAITLIEDELIEVRTFSLLRNIFEGKVFDTTFAIDNAEKIQKAASPSIRHRDPIASLIPHTKRQKKYPILKELSISKP